VTPPKAFFRVAIGCVFRCFPVSIGSGWNSVEHLPETEGWLVLVGGIGLLRVFYRRRQQTIR
jgi:hypothetical protein